jgi:Domain of unknown function (DUF2760)
MPSFGARVAYAVRCFFAVLFHATIPPEILAALTSAPPVGGTAPAAAPPPAAPAPRVPEDPGERAVQMLAIFQRDGRLVDFLREDLSAYTDAQVGAAVRDVHANCRRALDRYLPVEAVLADEEGQATVVSAPVDPATVRLVGNVGQQATYRGTVRHRGWRVGRIALPPLLAADARLIVAPAEVEVG